jgi:hypothetical protein
MPDIAGAVWRTTDAGQHWTTTALRDQLLDIGISDSLNIICIGGGYDEGAEIARTTDGGDTWQFSVLGFPRFYGQALAIAFRTPSEGWSVLGSAGAAMTTSDSGNTWSLATIKKSVNFFDIAFTDERHGYVVGANGLVLSYNAPALIAVKQNWNLVSVPSAVADRRKSTLFPTATSQAFAFTPAGYEQKDTLTGEAGYWIKFPADEIVAVPGVPVYSDTVGVIAGWNIVGSVSAPIPAAAIRGVGTTIISPFYGYDGGYAVADSLLPGRGYWVKVMAAGELILSADAAGAINPHAEIHRK